jgi:hypothetical protein
MFLYIVTVGSVAAFETGKKKPICIQTSYATYDCIIT